MPDQRSARRPETPPKPIHLRNLSWQWLIGCVACIVVLAVSLGTALGVTVHQDGHKLQGCQQGLSQLTAKSDTTSPTATRAQQTTTQHATATATTSLSTCNPNTTWLSPLTNTSYTQHCNQTLATSGRSEVMASTLTETFEACVSLCDVFNYGPLNGSMEFATWYSLAREMSNQPQGRCFCAMARDGDHWQGEEGRMSVLREGALGDGGG